MAATDRPPSAALLVEGKSLLDAALAAGQVDVAYVAALSDVYDRYFRERLDEYGAGCPDPSGFALVAVGGYGRRELCPASDIDVLVVFGGESSPDAPNGPSAPKGPEGSDTSQAPGMSGAPELARFLFFPLWDLGVELGHGVRTIGQCLDLARNDWQVLASFLDLRFLAGDRAVCDSLAARLAADVFPAQAAGFAGWLARGNEERKAAHGDAGGMLEPNLKNGLGGLRDAHQVRWLLALDRDRDRDARVLAPELAALGEDVRFVLSARMHLHRLSGRKNDRLYFEFQERLSEALGFGARGDRKGVERFLARLLRAMADIKALRLSAWPLLAGAVGAIDLAAPATIVAGGVELAPEGLRFAPGLSDAAAMEGVFDLLLACATSGRAPSHDTLRRLRAMAGELGRLAGVSPRTGRHLYDSLGEIMMADVTGLAMDAAMTTGILRAALPEFARVEDIVAFDIYHIHPVGRHSLEAVRLLAEVRAGGEGRYFELLSGLPRPELAFWGLLLHDVGKGLGGGHAEKGAELAEAMLARLSAPPEARHTVGALVREHLLLPDTATGRDLSDRDVVARVAGRVATVERLDMLTLIARCDGLATGPQAWTGWKETLVFDLYAKVRSTIEQGRLFGASDARIMLATRDRLRDLARGRMAPEALEQALLAMPPRYLVAEEPETIMGHLALLAELDAVEAEGRRMRPGGRGQDVAALSHEALPAADGFRVTVAARNVRALFATVAGVLALHDLSICDADVFVWDGGVTILSLTTGNPPDVLYADEVFARVSRAIRYTLSGKLFLAYRLAKKRASFLSRPPAAGPRTPPVVLLDNRASDLFTVIEVACDDRVGLLYDIARTLYELRLETHLAKVMTPAGRVRDVFYVRGADGRRVEDPEQAEEIKAALLHRLADDLCALH
ncbi:metal dependent phosphohydrolase [Solidesulfovibrio carbinoliphilus subsp. oakridgensis]|uniref:Bifunctional uridylyltransferase/uridylyl-removing enzyme n=1 Tax=Solidesulfovibrio carbinoliphilus subsp. oakridgensis TaxID=694327 RepID=G7QBA4_9BACT|nr:HD domain-containing protein [Solidesulfovibrio carbinoliphilus]EHJ49327.1 metal dependent phosphohydrolase [Solidesulfovibrio carbinoliphilus subsp. oakridgensis]